MKTIIPSFFSHNRHKQAEESVRKMFRASSPTTEINHSIIWGDVIAGVLYRAAILWAWGPDPHYLNCRARLCNGPPVIKKIEFLASP
jgi:hypothetical protein